jgi:hypothetical protein
MNALHFTGARSLLFNIRGIEGYKIHVGKLLGVKTEGDERSRV